MYSFIKMRRTTIIPPMTVNHFHEKTFSKRTKPQYVFIYAFICFTLELLFFSKINIHIQNIREYQSTFVLIQTDVIGFIIDSCLKYDEINEM